MTMTSLTPQSSSFFPVGATLFLPPFSSPTLIPPMLAMASLHRSDSSHSISKDDATSVPLIQPSLVRLPSILNRTPTSFSTFLPTPPSFPGTPNNDPFMSVSPVIPTRPNLQPTNATSSTCSFSDGNSRSSSSTSSAKGSLLARRRSSTSGKARPDMSLELPPLPPTDVIRETVIGHAAEGDSIGSPKSDPGTPRGRIKGVVEKAFQAVKGRRPTPFPEKPVFIDDDESEGSGGEETEEEGKGDQLNV